MHNYNNATYLIHYGVKGQKRGIRRFQNEDGSLTAEGKEHYGIGETPEQRTKRIQNEASKDAKEYARAKAYYGKGAGTRRKQIKNLISEKMKDPDYKREFENHLSKQNMSEHQKAANRERKVQDTKDKAARIGRGIKNLLLGVGTTSMAAIAIYNGAKMVGADKKIASVAKTAMSKVTNAAYSMKSSSNYGGGASAFASFMNRR